MDPYLQEIVNTLETTRMEVGHIVREASLEALNWRPGPEANSLFVIATHVAGAERFWIGEVVGGQPAQRHRDAEFQARCETESDREALLMRLSDVGHTSWQVLSQLSLPQLLETRTARGRQVMVMWCILHILEHNSLHRGHMQLTTQLWEQAHPGEE
jgi:uncharacterized damage-inducible protein DinB